MDANFSLSKQDSPLDARRVEKHLMVMIEIRAMSWMIRL